MEEITAEDRTSEQMLAAVKDIHAQASALADSIISLLGKNPNNGRVSYCAQLAIQYLETCMFRANEGCQFLLQTAPDVREKVAEETLRGAGNFTLEKGGVS